MLLTEILVNSFQKSATEYRLFNSAVKKRGRVRARVEARSVQTVLSGSALSALIYRASASKMIGPIRCFRVAFKNGQRRHRPARHRPGEYALSRLMVVVCVVFAEVDLFKFSQHLG